MIEISFNLTLVQLSLALVEQELNKGIFSLKKKVHLIEY